MDSSFHIHNCASDSNNFTTFEHQVELAMEFSLNSSTQLYRACYETLDTADLY